MDALVKTVAGPLEFTDRSRPTIGPADVLVETELCGICGSDLHIESGTHPCDPPVVIGHEFAGTVAERGDDVTHLEVGDRVGFRHSWNPFPGVDADGGFAEYMRAPAENVWTIPEELSFAEATFFEPIRVPMTMVRETAEMDPGERVVVSGPGPMGLLTANVASMDGAEHVTVLGTESDEEVRLPTAAELGADETAVFGDEALAAIAENPPSVWFETSGAAPAIEAAVEHVDSGGRVVCSGLGDGPWNVDMHRVAYDSLDIRGQWGGSDATLEGAVPAMIDGELNVSALVTDELPLSEWRTGFDRARSQDGIKILLAPGA
jgi:2-desacetyl-2-hydroxyethyl bacteriochlorophyllide A dehydrogenase